MLRSLFALCVLLSGLAPVFGQNNVYNQLTRTAAETTDSADVWIPIWDQPATPRKSFKISVAELFKEPKAVVIASGTLTDSAPAIDISQTFNDGTEAFTAFKLNVTDTASSAGSKLLDLQVGGVSTVASLKRGTIHFPVAFNSPTALPCAGIGNYYGFLGLYGQTGAIGAYVSAGGINTVGSNSTYAINDTVVLNSDAADRLALRRSTNAQKLSIYNTYTDGSNYERGVFDWKGTSNTLRIGTEHAGTGVARPLSIVTGGTERVNIASNGNITLTGSSYLTVPNVIVSSNSYNRATSFFGVSDDVALTRSAANTLKVTDGSTGFGQLDAKRTTLTGGSVTTASAPLVDATQTWNDGAVTFTGFKQNITDTASGVSSLLFDWQVGGVSYLKLTKFGDLVGSAFTGSDFSVRLQNGSLKQGSASITAWGSSNAAGTMDTALARGGAGIVKFTNASTGAGMIQLQEAGAAPSAPAADNVIIYAIDNGSGKTQLMALFSSGAAQQIAIQP